MGNGDFTVFKQMSSHISVNVANLLDPSTAPELIDHAIKECWTKSRPVYITLPTDMVHRNVEGARLKTNIDLTFPDNDPEQEDYCVQAIMKHIIAAKNPIILVDACAIRHRAQCETHDLMVKSGFPTFVAPMGKGAVDETLPNYGGVYAGNGSLQDVQDAVNNSDLILSIGAIKSDFNTAGFTYRTSQLATIDFHSAMVKVKYSEYNGLRMNGVLKQITSKLAQGQPKKPQYSITPKPQESDSQVITHQWFWPRLSNWVQTGDIILTETGTSGYGIWEVQFQRDTTGISQILWGSIGYATASTQGAALAAKELGDRRTILFTGDGSFQLTAQELATMIRQKLKPILFVICNEGYTIERFIHGMKAAYNDVGDWKYKDLVSALGATEGSYRTYQIKTRQEAEQLLADKQFAAADVLQVSRSCLLSSELRLTIHLVRRAVYAQGRRSSGVEDDGRSERQKQCERVVVVHRLSRDRVQASKSVLLANSHLPSRCPALWVHGLGTQRWGHQMPDRRPPSPYLHPDHGGCFRLPRCHSTIRCVRGNAASRRLGATVECNMKRNWRLRCTVGLHPIDLCSRDVGHTSRHVTVHPNYLMVYICILCIFCSEQSIDYEDNSTFLTNAAPATRRRSIHHLERLCPTSV